MRSSASGGDPRAIIIHHDLDTGLLVVVAQRIGRVAKGHPDHTLLGRKRSRVVDQIVQHLAEPRIVALDDITDLLGLAVPLIGHDVQGHRDVATPRYAVRNLDHSGRERREIDELLASSRQFGIEPGSVGNVADQPIEATDIVVDNGEQPRAGLVVF